MNNSGEPETIVGEAEYLMIRLADEIVGGILEHAAAGRTYVLGLATGSTPLPLYAELVRRHRNEGLSFQNVVTFNLDEYEHLKPDDPMSYHAFMRKELFDHVDIKLELTFIPPAFYEDELSAAQAYERTITQYGGIDLQIVGIGSNGHIGFNEPGSEQTTRTRRVELTEATRRAAAKGFGGLENVPTHAMTMGVETIMEARRIILLATGAHKAAIVQKAMSGNISSTVPATFLQDHSSAAWYLDTSAAGR